jgi:uncharacterized protein (TIGR00290 family)
LNKEKVIFSWSGGKDSTLCLHSILNDSAYEVCYLLTSINGNLKRVSMHGIHESLIEAQAQSIGIPLKKVYVYEANNEEYEKQMSNILNEAKTEGIYTVIFGDIFLEDLRVYREANLAKLDMKAVFPLWERNTSNLIREFLNLNYKTIVCCANDAYLQKEQVGKLIDLNYITQLENDVDPCGENGEYHTFCYEGPIFKIPIHINVTDKLYKPLELEFQTPDKNNKITKGFWFADIELQN